MSKLKQVIAWIDRWASVTTVILTILTVIIAMITLIYTIYDNDSVKVTNVDGSVKVTNFRETSLCNGFLVDDPLSYLLTNTSLSEKEKEYLESKINCYRDQIQKNPKDAEAYTNIGEAERRLGNLEAARKAHQKALELKADLPQAQMGLALVEQDKGNTVAANQAIKGALALNPTSAIAHFYQATILYAQNDFKDAEIAWQKAKELDPKLPKLVRTWRLPNLRNVLGWHKNDEPRV